MGHASLLGIIPHTYHQRKDNETQLGFIAQEFEKVIPELVRIDKQGFKSIDYVKLTPVLVEAIKEQQKQIDELKQLVDRLMNKQD